MDPAGTVPFGRSRYRSVRLFGGFGHHVDRDELVVELAGMQQSFKPAAGDLVLYPSTSLHQVAPVTEGERIVCIGWIESSVRDGAGRDILFDLENLRVSLAQRLDAQSAEMLTLAKAIANLQRHLGD